jgi:putative ABC transport system substrate-binding protein
VGTAAAASALSKADVRTPVVFLAINYDPVRAGVVKSFARPGGNATGVYLQHEAVAPKRLDVLREVLPRARRFAVLSDQHTLSQLEAIRLAASKTDLALTVVPAEGDLVDLAAAVERAKTAKVEGVVVLGSPIFAQRYRELADLLLKRRLPGIGSTAAADGGLLFAYGSDNMKAAMRTAELAARVLKGAKPAETPVEQADEFELVINVKTAKALGIKLPYALLARASRVIQ